MEKPYYIYLLRCEDNSLYAGITTDPARRFSQHAGERPGGAKYTAHRRPLRFEALWLAPDRSSASKLEYRLKQLSHSRKEELAAGDDPPELLPENCRRLGNKALAFFSSPYESANIL